MLSPKDWLDPFAWAWLALVVLSVRFCLRKQTRLGLSLGAFAILLSLGESARLPVRLAALKEASYYSSSIAQIPGANARSAEAIVHCGGLLSASPHDVSGANFSDAVDRLLCSVEAARRLSLPLVLGGGAAGGRSDITEASIERAWLTSLGQTNLALLELGVCKNTHEEALSAARLAKRQGWKRILLVTSAIHMDRALAAFRRTGLEVVPLACDFDGAANPASRWRFRLFPSVESAALFKLWLTEEVGFCYYRLRGWV
jgi:uncharacterized SAM-binding protein YcdF (DUF218 family)